MTEVADHLAQRGLTLKDWLDNALWLAYKNREDYGNKRGLQATADDVLKTEDALIRAGFKGAGSVAEIDAWVRQSNRHAEAVEEKQNKYASVSSIPISTPVKFYNR